MTAKKFFSFNDKRLKYFYAKKHTTLYKARNLACEKASGEYIAFLDCDDYWYDNFLSSRINFLKKNRLIILIQIQIIILKKQKEKYYILKKIEKWNYI